MNRHAEIRKLLAVYESLNAVDRDAVDAHIRMCEACASRQKVYAEIDTRLIGLADLTPPATLAKSLDAILRSRQPRSRRHAGESDRRWFPRQVLLPAGLVFLLLLSVWLMMRVLTPVDHGVAQTPSVTPTETPVAIASPQNLDASASAELLSWLATRYPAPSASDTDGAPWVMASLERSVPPLTTATLRSSVLPVLSTVAAHR